MSPTPVVLGALPAASPHQHQLRAAPAWAKGATVLHLSAASPARRWPPQRWAAVARAEAAAGRTVVVAAGPGEGHLASTVLHLVAGSRAAPILPAGRTDLAQLMALVAVAGRLVCGETCIAQLATALGTPAVVLFGPALRIEIGEVLAALSGLPERQTCPAQAMS